MTYTILIILSAWSVVGVYQAIKAIKKYKGKK